MSFCKYCGGVPAERPGMIILNTKIMIGDVIPWSSVVSHPCNYVTYPLMGIIPYRTEKFEYKEPKKEY